MSGMSRTTGALIGGAQHLAQSIADIMTTPVGTRVGRRDYGSRILDLTDAPVNATTRVRLFAATATALLRWEPRIKVQRVALSAIDGQAGRFALTVSGEVRETGDAVQAAVPLAPLAGRT
jgi:phage baseplate assembly protein W